MMKLFFVLLVFWLCSCSNSDSVSVYPQNTSLEIAEDSLVGMFRVRTAESVAILGTDLEKAKANETPAMQVKFDYDFSIGKHEVTCGEFNSLMKPLTGHSLDCEGDSLPATNLTYYDAVLYANERSKAEGFDTAYTYISVSFDTEKHCTNLAGLVFRPEVNAYRLPTEAEWNLVAASNWKKGWTADNAKQKLHNVCSRDTAARICDMVGNAMEWVNDWLGNLRDTTIVNYVGAPDGGALGQRVVKGGSYRNASKSINIYSRGDVYTVTSSTRADYVGFRLAYGAIPNPIWMNAKGTAATSRILPLATPATMRSLTGTYKVKLAFRNDLTGNLAFINYGSGSLSVVEIEDSLAVYHPEISPDGQWVAFCTKLEGVFGTSTVFVRRLNADGSDLVKLNVESAVIPRWRVLENGDTVVVYVTDAGNNKNDASFKASSTWQVKFANGKFGTPQKLFDGAYHGGFSEDRSLAVTGARLLRARVLGRDTVWYGGEQACNASLSKDGSKRTLFLDFGGTTGQKFVGEKYGTHEQLLIADSLGKLIQSIPAPAGYSFDHSEWVFGSDNLVVATLSNDDGAHTKIVSVNLQDSSIVDILEGDEVWHPSLWANPNVIPSNEFLLDLDSAGMYFIEGGSDRSKILRYRMEMMWKYRDSAELVVLGSSRAANGIDASIIGVTSVNLSYFPNSFFDVCHMYERYVEKGFKKLKYIVVSIDIDFWNFSPQFSFFSSEYEQFPGYVYDQNHNYWLDEDCSAIYVATQNAPGLDTYKGMFLGLRSSEFATSQGWGVSEYEDSTWMDKQRAAYEETYVAFVDFLKVTQQKGLTVVGIVFPQSPDYRNSGIWGRHGLRRSEAVKILDSLARLQKKYPHFIFMDENKMGYHDYDDSMAQDCDHMNARGAEQLTVRLDSLLKTLK